MAHMSEADVVQWLSTTVALPQYSNIFQENDIDGTVLIGLSDSDLKDLGISSFGHRRKIIDCAKQLGGGGGFSHAPPAHAKSGAPKHAAGVPKHTPGNPKPAPGKAKLGGPPKAQAAPAHNLKSSPAPSSPGGEQVPLFRLTLEGQGLHGGQIGEDVSFHIKALDPKSNSSKNIDGSKLNLSVDGPAPVHVQVSGGGSEFTVTYKVTHAGDYYIDVQYDGKSVLPKPVKATFSAGADPHFCYADYPTTSPVEHQLTFHIYAKDSSGSPVTNGGEPFKVNVSAPDSTAISQLSIENEEDVYTLTCILHTPGNYTFHVMLHEQPISNSPFTIMGV